MEVVLVFVLLIWLISTVAEKFSEFFGSSKPYTPPSAHSSSSSSDIREHDINSIGSSGKFSAAERKAEYRRRGKSPSGVIDGVYNDAYRGNDEYNDTYRDHDADA